MKKFKKILIYLFLSVASFISIFPFLWMLISMTNKSVEITKGRLLPGNHLFENFKNLIQTMILAPLSLILSS